MLARLSSRAHFILFAPVVLVDKAPPCPPGDAMALITNEQQQQKKTCEIFTRSRKSSKG